MDIATDENKFGPLKLSWHGCWGGGGAMSRDFYLGGRGGGTSYAARSTTMILTHLFCDCEHRVNMVYKISFQSYVSSSWLIYGCLVCERY